MTKPLGYYCDFRSGDESYIADLELSSGSFLQRLEYRVLLELAIGVHTALIEHELEKLGQEPSYSTTTYYRQNLSPENMIGLSEFLLAQIKERRKHP